MLHFLGIGAQKAGTSWIYEQLRQHPELNFPVGKENHFWDGVERGRHTKSVAEYAALFESSERHLAGEITPAYAALQPESIALIQKNFPELRIFFSVRDPVERAWSAARMFLDNAWLQPDELSSGFLYELCSAESFTRRGHYSLCLQNWLRYYDSSQIHLIDYAQISNDPASVLADLYRYLGVGGATGVVNAAVTARVRPGKDWQLPPSVRGQLIALYEPLVVEFRQLLGREFGKYAINTETWLRP